jgi:cytoskeletal protein CcmA (bactofilin family)
MSKTTFSGPVASQNGFEGALTGNVAGAIAATTLSTTGAVTINGTSVIISDLPTADPEVAGQLYVTAGALMVSAGA